MGPTRHQLRYRRYDGLEKLIFMREDTSAEALPCMLLGYMRSVLLRLCAAELPTQNKIRRIWSDITPIAHELP